MFVCLLSAPFFVIVVVSYCFGDWTVQVLIDGPHHPNINNKKVNSTLDIYCDEKVKWNHLVVIVDCGGDMQLQATISFNIYTTEQINKKHKQFHRLTEIFSNPT